MKDFVLAIVEKGGWLRLQIVGDWGGFEPGLAQARLKGLGTGSGPWTCARCDRVVAEGERVGVLFGKDEYLVAHVRCPGMSGLKKAD